MALAIIRSTETSSPTPVAPHIWGLLAGDFPDPSRRENRYNPRYAYPHLLRVVPVGPDGQITGPPVIACGKNLSVDGMGFYHATPLPCREVILLFDRPSQEDLAILTRLAWCRFTRFGWYESGGRFLQVLDIDEVDLDSFGAAADHAGVEDI